MVEEFSLLFSFWMNILVFGSDAVFASCLWFPSHMIPFSIIQSIIVLKFASVDLFHNSLILLTIWMPYFWNSGRRKWRCVVVGIPRSLNSYCTFMSHLWHVCVMNMKRIGMIFEIKSTFRLVLIILFFPQVDIMDMAHHRFMADMGLLLHP